MKQKKLVPITYDAPPVGYPCMLYQIKVGTDWRYATGIDANSAIKKVADKGRAKPLKVTALIANSGHKQTHRFLKRFGNNWVCREGLIYYPNDER